MAEEVPRISLLPDDIRTKVSSSCTIITSEDVIEGLVRNALDAHARSITIEADFTRGFFTVSDDGAGIRDIEFLEQGQLAKPHCSSRFDSASPTYGRHGQFLSRLSSLSLLSVASQHRLDPCASRLVLHRGIAISRQTRLCKEEVGLVRQGTHVEVYNLFGDVPVRFKQLSLRYTLSSEIERTFELVREMLVGYMLAYPRPAELRFFLRGNKHLCLRCNSSKPNGGQFSLESTACVLFQAKLVNMLDTNQWRSASVRTTHFSIRAAISIEPSPTKSAQFMSIGQLPIRRRQGSHPFFETIDQLFEASSFGALDDDIMVKGVDRWPVFYLRIDTKSEQMCSLAGQYERTADSLPLIGHLTKALESLFSHFLSDAGFARGLRVRRPRRLRGQRNHQRHAREQTNSQLPASELSRGATEARYLTYWNRVKSARPSEEDFRYGLGFDKPTDCIDPAADLVREEPPCDDQDTGELQSEAAKDDMQVNDSDIVDDSVSLAWTNPQNGRVVHLNPRTGAIMPASASERVSHSEHYCGHQCEHQHFGETEEPRISLVDRAKPQARLPMANLGKYLHNTRFQRTEAPSACITSEELLALNGESPAIGLDSYTISVSQAVTRSALSAATVVQQVDQKFVLITVKVSDNGPRNLDEQAFMVLVDQHAADERIKFEQLCQDLCKRASTSLSKPLVFEVDEVEAALLEKLKAHFQLWCLDYNLTQQHLTESRKYQIWRMEVTTLPSLIAERCRAEPKLLIDLIRQEAWSARARSDVLPEHLTTHSTSSWWSEIAHCPEGIVEILKSRSCRTAIMFNDIMGVDHCSELVQKLSRCAFPFQCAHGRPTLTALADLGNIDESRNIGSLGTSNSNITLGYGDAWRDWIGID